jgi:hypothetical protein
MFDPNVVTDKFIAKAFVFLLLMLLWNFAGRYLQSLTPDSIGGAKGSELIVMLASIIHISAIVVVLFIVLTSLISGVGQYPTDFRYVSF